MYSNMMRKVNLSKRKKIIIAVVAILLILVLVVGVLLFFSKTSSGANEAQKRLNTLTLVRTYVEKGEFARALALLENILIANPDDSEASELLDIVIIAKRAQEKLDRGEAVDRTELEEALAAAREASTRIASAADEAWRAASRMRSAENEQKKISRETSNKTSETKKDKDIDEDALSFAEKNADSENARREAEDSRALEERLAKKNERLQQQIAEVNRNIGLGKQAAVSGSLRSARESFTQAAGLLPEGENEFNAGKYLEMAQSLYEIAQDTHDSTIKTEALSGSLEYTNQALKADSKSAKAHWLRSQIYSDQGREPQSLADLKEAVRLDLKNYQYVYELGKKHYMQRQYSDARSCFETTIRLAPSFESAFFNLGLTNRRLGRIDASIESFRGAVRIKKEYPRAYIEIARLLAEKGDLDGAVKNYSTAIQYEPANVQALREMAAVYSTQEKYKEAERYFREALALGSDDPRTNYNMATVQLELGNNALALDYAKKAVSVEPKNSVFLYTYGLAGERNNMPDIALQQYARSIASDPKYVKPRINLGIMYLDAKRLEDALNQFVAAHTVEPDNFEVNNNLGKVYGLKKQYDKAVEFFARAVSKNPRDSNVRANLATAYISAGLIEKASDTYAELIKIDPSDWDSHYELGKLYMQLEKKSEAKSVLENLLRKKPDYEKSAEVKKLINTL